MGSMMNVIDARTRTDRGSSTSCAAPTHGASSSWPAGPLLRCLRPPRPACCRAPQRRRARTPAWPRPAWSPQTCVRAGIPIAEQTDQKRKDGEGDGKRDQTSAARSMNHGGPHATQDAGQGMGAKSSGPIPPFRLHADASRAPSRSTARWRETPINAEGVQSCPFSNLRFAGEHKPSTRHHAAQGRTACAGKLAAGFVNHTWPPRSLRRTDPIFQPLSDLALKPALHRIVVVRPRLRIRRESNSDPRRRRAGRGHIDSPSRSLLPP